MRYASKSKPKIGDRRQRKLKMRKVIRPLKFDKPRREHRNEKARVARARREAAKLHRVFHRMICFIEPWAMFDNDAGNDNDG